MIPSLAPNYRAVVFGASGGVGGAFVRALAGDPRCAAVHAGARRLLDPAAIAADAPDSAAKIAPFVFDLTDEASIAASADRLFSGAPESAPDLVIVATGVLHAQGMSPEKSFRALDPAVLARAYAVNAIGPALIAKHFLPLLPRGRKAVFAALSARVASISDNRAGGWHAYRASKAALNMLIRNCAIELALKNKSAVCVTLHPGTVDTALSAPFRAGVPSQQLVAPETSAANLLRVIDGLGPTDSGRLFAWDGQAIPF